MGKRSPYFGIPIPEVSSDQSSSDIIHKIVHPDHQVSEHTSKWTKDHPLENIIGALDRPVSTRLQLHEQALFCYYDAFLTSVEPKNYKEALTQACIDSKSPVAPVARLEAIRIFPGFAARHFMLATLRICDPYKPNHVYKLKKAPYGETSSTPWWKKSKQDEEKEGRKLRSITLFVTFIGSCNPKDSSIALTAFADVDHAGLPRYNAVVTSGIIRCALTTHCGSCDRLKIGKCNLRLSSDITSKEATLQVVYDVLKLTPFYKAFQVTADAPEIYMQEFWASAYVHNRSGTIKMNNKKAHQRSEQFRDILQICPKVGNKKFVDPPLESEIIIFLASLGHTGDIRKLSDLK
ncbi:hypothetical protein Tco_0442530 [Tanacetum coccineum]